MSTTNKIEDQKQPFSFYAEKNKGPSTFFSRLDNFINVTNPLLFFKTHSSLLKAQELVNNLKQREIA